MATTEAERDRIARFIAAQLRRLGWDGRRLEIESGLDKKTVDSLITGKRWPQQRSRQKVEEVLGIQAGTLEAVRLGFVEVEEEGDPVERAIYASELTRPNQLKLAGIYYEMLEAQAASPRSKGVGA